MAKLFGTDGIRAKAGSWPLTSSFVLRLGQIAGLSINNGKSSTVVIGRDTRRSGIVLQNAIVTGFLDAGANVIDLGVLPTPAVSWAVRQLEADAGIVISASHNPADENGIKFFGRGGQKLSESLEGQIESLLVEPDYIPPIASIPGRLFRGDFLQELYIRDLAGEHPGAISKKLKLLVDCANGAASFLASDVFTRYGAEVISINSMPDGENINRRAGSEFVRRHVDEFSGLIKSFGADFGIAFDGDADRVVFVDERGHLVDGDHVLGILARYFDDKNRLLKRSVVTTVMRNNGLKAYLSDRNLEIYETPVGDKYVTEQLTNLAENMPVNSALVGLGGEQSGHVILLDSKHMTGDGMRTALYVLDAYCESSLRTLAELAESVGKTPQVVASAFVGHGNKLSSEEISLLSSNLHTKYPDIERSNLRYSGTEPLFRVMLEGNHAIDIRELAAIARDLCKRAQEVAQCEGHIDILNSTHGGVIHLDQTTQNMEPTTVNDL